VADIKAKESRLTFALAGAWGLWGVVLLAMGGHPPESGIASTGGQFLLFHAPVVMAVALQSRFSGIYKRAALALLLAGSGAFALEITMHIAYGRAIAGPLAPIGRGMAILGWLCVIIGSIRGGDREAS
jgi:uncharacterized membrane protein YgdD (TMEM256/DUF423 family)